MILLYLALFSAPIWGLFFIKNKTYEQRKRMFLLLFIGPVLATLGLLFL